MAQSAITKEITLISPVDTNGQVTLGNARFTVIAPNCIRMEYAPRHGFVDEPTLFAYNRSARCKTAKITKDDNILIIDTGKMLMEYRPDGSASMPRI